MTTVAHRYPARTDSNGTTWYRGESGDGWTADLAQAHPDYRAKDAPAPLCAPLAHETASADTTTPTPEENAAMTALTDDFEVYSPPRFTQWMRYPLPPEPERPASTFNGWGWYQLPSPTTGRPTGFPRATTIADTLDDTYGLSRWKRRETAMRIYQLATMAPDTVVWRDDTGETTAADCLGNLIDAMGGSKVTAIDTVLDVIDNIMGGAEARELGECAHAWLGAVNAGTALIHQVPDIVRPHVEHGLRVLAHRGIVVLPEYTERTVLNDQGEETVAGKIDGIGRLLTTGELVLLDVKTNKDLKYSWLSYGVQVGGVYGWATKVLSTDGRSWEPFPDIRQDFAVLLHIPSDQPERAAAITIDRQWGGETMVASLETRRRRKEAKVEVPKHAIPTPSAEAIRYCEARNALSAITTAEQGQAVFETYEDVWDDDLGQFAASIATLLD